MKRSASLCVAVIALGAVAWLVVGCADFAPALPSPDGGPGPAEFDLYGKVTQDESPSPLPDTLVRAVPSETCTPAQKGFGWVDTTDANGDYGFPALPPGKYEVTFSNTLYPDEVRCVELVDRDVELNVDMHGVFEPADIYGQVLDCEGSPLEGANVYALEPNPAGVGDKVCPTWSDTTDVQGGYRLTGIPIGPRKVFFYHPQFGSEERDITMGSADYTLDHQFECE